MFIDRGQFKLSWRKKIALNLALIIIHVLLGNVSVLLKLGSTDFSPIWLPSGLSMAAALIFGVHNVIPGIVLGVFLLGLQYATPSFHLMGLIFSNLLECIMGSMLLLSLGKGYFKFKSPRDILSFIVIGVLLAPLVSSTVYISHLYLGSMINIGRIPEIWSSFFIANSLGILILTPLTVSFFYKDTRKISITECSFLYIVLGLASYWAFEGKPERKFLFIPLLTWVALQFGFRGVSIAALVVGAIGIWKSTFILGVLDGIPEMDILGLQFLIAGIAIVGYFMATVAEAQEKAQEKELELTINLHHKKIAEEALAILDQSIHKSPIGFALIDKDYKYIRINEKFASINGAPSETHTGKSLRDMIPLMADNIIPLIDRVFKTGQSLMNIPFKGNGLAGLVSYYPVRHPSTNEIFGVAVSFQDITEQQKAQHLLRENQDRLMFAQEAGKIGAFEWDVETNRIFWTPELESIHGLIQGEFGGSFEGWLNLIHPDDINITIEEFKKVMNGECELNHQFRIITKSQETRWILARGKLVRDGQGHKVKLIGIGIDLTEQKAIEQKLRLTEANLLHALSVRDEFMAIASHELKTPLTSLKLQIQLYQRGVLRRDPSIYTPEKMLGFLEKNAKQVDRLTRLVDDMLDISRIRTGKFTVKKESCELSSMLKDILHRTREQFDASGSGEPIIEHLDEVNGDWDPLRIDQVMTNIITNAIRYGQGRPITISIKNHEEGVRFMVRDQGLGIPKSDHAKIFQRYERGLLSREVSGLGLGLFISQQIVEAHGGRIWIESELNQGATFYVDLPVVSDTMDFFHKVDRLLEGEHLSAL